jgi:hypothetical protein
MIDVDISLFQFVFDNYSEAGGPSLLLLPRLALNGFLATFYWTILRVLTQFNKKWLNFDNNFTP